MVLVSLCVQVTVRLEAEGTAPEAAQARGLERLVALSTAPSLLSAGVRVSAPAPRAAGMLQLGQLRGNAFILRLRGVEAESAVVQRAAQSLKAHGFINYYVRPSSLSSSPMQPFHLLAEGTNVGCRVSSGLARVTCGAIGSAS